MRWYTLEEYLDEREANHGYCVECDSFTCGGVEPDAQGYPCPVCNANATVFGAEIAFTSGMIEVREAENEADLIYLSIMGLR